MKKERKQRVNEIPSDILLTVHSSALADHSRLKPMKSKAQTAKHRQSTATATAQAHSGPVAQSVSTGEPR